MVELLYVSLFIEHPATVSKVATIAVAANTRAIGLSWATRYIRLRADTRFAVPTKCTTCLEISPHHDLYSTKDTYTSLALTNGVSLTRLSEQTGMAVATILKH